MKALFMKALFFIVISMTTLLSTNGQINKGSNFLGGALAGSSQKETKDGVLISNQVGIVFTPLYGEAVKDNLIVGGQLIFSSLKEEFTLTNTVQHQEEYGVGLFIRRYYPIKSSQFYIFIEKTLGGVYSPFIQTITLGGKENRYDYKLNLNVNPGVAYALTDKLHLETGFVTFIGLQFFHEKREQINSITTIDRTSTLNLISSLNNIGNFYIGFRLLIAEK